MTYTQTRYFDSVQETINGKLFNELNTSYTGSAVEKSIGSSASYHNVKVGIRVWKRSGGGTETEITSGTPVAVLSWTPSSQPSWCNYCAGAGWAAPQTTLASTDSIVVRAYYSFNGGAWTDIGFYDFSTEQLGASQLDSATWTVYYNLAVAGTPTHNYWIWYPIDQNEAYTSEIDNFKWNSG
jgi:hypothetical protein